MKTLPLLMSVVLLAALLHEGVHGWGSTIRFQRRRTRYSPAQCTVPADNPDNGVWSRSGSRLHLVCNSGYELVGTHRTCQNGQWSGSSPFCRAICNSASRPTLDHGGATCTSQSCSFTCDAGYTRFPHTSTSATCSAPNTWSPSPPTCLRCLEPTLADGTVSCSDPESCSFTCDMAHTMVGSSSADCIRPHTWSPSLPTCVKNCGIPATAPIVDYSSRARNGHEAEPHSWPWMVSFRAVDAETRAVHHCGGSLVDSQWVVTSATCANEMRSLRTDLHFPIHAVIGAHDIRVGRAVPEHDIDEFFLHPQHFITAGRADVNDIALIKLRAPVTYSDEVFPVCLPAAGSLSLARGTACVATGWGKAEGRFAMEDKLLQVVLPVSTPADCQTSLQPNSFCAGVVGGGRELCWGDEGGPLVHQQNGYWTLVGVASHSTTRCQPSEDARGTVFTDVAAFRQWLETTVRDNP